MPPWRCVNVAPSLQDALRTRCTPHLECCLRIRHGSPTAGCRSRVREGHGARTSERAMPWLRQSGASDLPDFADLGSRHSAVRACREVPWAPSTTLKISSNHHIGDIPSDVRPVTGEYSRFPYFHLFPDHLVSQAMVEHHLPPPYLGTIDVLVYLFGSSRPVYPTRPNTISFKIDANATSGSLHGDLGVPN